MDYKLIMNPVEEIHFSTQQRLLPGRI